MTFELYNTGIEPIIVEQGTTATILQPCQKQIICSDSNEVKLKLSHIKNDKLSIIWYVLNEVFTLEQMRTVLVVNGEYLIRSLENNSKVKVKKQEFVFDKNTSYETFVFSTSGASVQRKKLEVANGAKVLKKARWLYMFGGDKTLLPLSGIALLVLIISILVATDIPTWRWGVTAIVFASFIWYLIKYIKSLKFLRKFISEEAIFEYLSSERKEYRTFSDELTKKRFNENAEDEVYW